MEDAQMDYEAFDRWTRMLGVLGTRRTALGALLSVGALRPGSSRAKSRPRRRKTHRLETQAQSGLRDCPVPGPGQNLSKCDFTGRDLRGANLRGANLSGADFERANLCGANLRGANLFKVDFKDANLTRADLRGTNLSTANLTGAIFCETRRPNGALDNSTCLQHGSGPCCEDSQCSGSRRCRNGVCLQASCISLDQVCNPFWGASCCANTTCRATAAGVVFTCQSGCSTDQECQTRFNTQDVHCVPDVLACPGNIPCCRPKLCRDETRTTDCPTSHVCCQNEPGNGICCLQNQVCTRTFSVCRDI
jgi:hypothetical protein